MGEHERRHLVNRRTMLKGVGAAGLTVAAYPICHLTGIHLTNAVVAQEASPSASPAALPTPLAGWVAAWEAQPLEAAPIAAAYTADAVYEEVATGVSLHSQEEIEEYLTGFFAAFSDGRAEVETAFASGDQAAATWTFTGRYTTQLPGFPPPGGQSITIRGASILQLREGMIERETQYWDVYAILSQLGAVPGGASPAAETPTA